MAEISIDAPGKKNLRQQEAELDARASLLDQSTDIDTRESIRIIGRGMKLLRYFWGRFTIKYIMMWGALAAPVMLLPWPVKIIIDHVVLDKPLEEAKNYPVFIRPLIEYMYGYTPWEILVTLVGIAVFMVITIGAFAPESNDTVEAGMEEGHDVATKTDNKVHGGHSFAGGIWGYFEFLLNMRLTQSVNHTLRAQLFEKIKSLPVTTLEDQRIGDAVYRVMYDTPSINYIFYEVINRPLMSTTVFLMAMFTMLSAYPNAPEVVWFAFALFPVYFVLTLPFSRIMRRRGQASRAAGTITTSTIEEGMDNVLAVQSLGGNKQESERFDADSGDSFTRYRHVVLVYIVIGQLMGLAHTLIITAVFFFISSKVITGEMTPGDYGALFFYFAWMRGPATSFSRLWIELQENVAGMRRVFALMDLPSEEDMGSRELPYIQRGVSMRGVGLVYPDGRRALTEINLEANVGQIVALVGPTGAGKTSLAYLIPRFRVASEGEVLIDDVDVNDVTMSSLRSQVTYVFQETQLFSDSIFDNIRFGKPEATLEEVQKVARIAGAHDFVSKLPDGYDTKLGTTSSKLSVGQKQRIAIARGLLRDSRILILDEPTSALDPETEEFLVSSLHEAARDRLVIIIAHRLSTISHADKIVFLEEGHIMEQGSHRELMAREGGHYRNFVNLQTRSG
ncbi:MAG: ABC transporter ATP-binding protein [Proteobacteria bacterium]|nr:ABC transporter ATP-binding protein [Pseudomonadota bacterium]